MGGKDAASKEFGRALSQTERYVLMLFYADGLTPAEIELVLDLPEHQVLATLDRMRGLARALLDRRNPTAARSSLPTSA